MHEIVGERPNITPVGLGNNDSEIDTSILRSSPDIDLSSQNPSTPAADLDDFDIGTDSEKGEVDVDEDADGPESEKRKKRKRENRGSVELMLSQRPKFGPKEPKSEKVVKPMRKAATNPIERFVDLSKAEEVTIQKKLDAQREKASATKELELERIRVAGTTKVQKEKVRADFELERLRLKQKHQLEIMEMQLSKTGSFSIAATSLSKV